jgi:hypothetical protein
VLVFAILSFGRPIELAAERLFKRLPDVPPDHGV